MRVLVIGNGSIGSHIARRFGDAGHSVTVAPRNFDAETQETFDSVVWCHGFN